MIKFINKNLTQHIYTSKPSKNGGTVYMTDILPVVASEHQKPLCRIYSTTDDLSAPIWELPMKCENRLNEATGNINTNLDVVLNSNDTVDTNIYVVVALPFNGIITSISVSDNVDILNGCFSKVAPFTLTSNDTIRYGKIVYLLLCVKSSDDITIKFNTESVFFAKGNKQSKKNKTLYINTFSININDIDEAAEYIYESERSDTVSIDENEAHSSPKFSSILNARIDVRVGGNRSRNDFQKSNGTPKVNKSYGGATFGDITTVKSHDNYNKTGKDRGKKSESTEKAMKKLNMYKNKFGE